MAVLTHTSDAGLTATSSLGARLCTISGVFLVREKEAKARERTKIC